ncbi:glycosyltransferase family 2 protein [Halofilum ochraceum]|uniref:glycosyltransferase family 2 protein n=1 Tax=Halofilum ochraceum TaxID=1611323 RepID=UPI0008DB27CC|nr:glycosyltransferase family 2 protein [Halofilum ochraceum]
MTEGEADIPVTVAIPAKNEEGGLARCLQCLGRFAEIVVIDSESTDRTAEIAESFGARVVQFRWNGKYPKKRNWFLLNVPPSQPWVLFLDSDEFVDNDFCNAVASAIVNERYNGYWLTYTNHFLGAKLEHGVAQRKLALFRVGSGLYERIEEDGWSGLDMEIHEHPIIEGRVGQISVPIDHRDYKGLAKFVERHKDYALWEARRYLQLQTEVGEWKRFTPRQRFKYRYLARWWYPLFYFLFAYFMKRGFLDRAAGFHYAYYKSWYFHTIRLLIHEHSEFRNQ